MQHVTGRRARGYKYSGSSTIDGVAWYYANSTKSTHPVGKKQPNELRLYDMSGNVFEWCRDWYDDYSSESQTDPIGSETGSNRVLCGGGWIYYAAFCRVSIRDYDVPDIRSPYYGFRVVLLP